MPELPPVTPPLIEPIIKALADMIDRHVDVVLVPIEARVNELQQQVAALESQLRDSNQSANDAV